MTPQTTGGNVWPRLRNLGARYSWAFFAWYVPEIPPLRIFSRRIIQFWIKIIRQSLNLDAKSLSLSSILAAKLTETDLDLFVKTDKYLSLNFGDSIQKKNDRLDSIKYMFSIVYSF